MSLLGDLFGYDQFGNDIAGYPQNIENSCIACGVACNAHSEKMMAACQSTIWSIKDEKL